VGFDSYIDEKGKKLNVWDIGLVKFAAMFFGIIIGAYMPFFVRQYLVVFIVLVLLFSVKPVYDAFR
jgi:cadmium resistance protein CadD (predicted permease)